MVLDSEERCPANRSIGAVSSTDHRYRTIHADRESAEVFWGGGDNGDRLPGSLFYIQYVLYNYLIIYYIFSYIT